MQAIMEGNAFLRVEISAIEVTEFKRQWPCSGLPDDKGITFCFQVSSGDLAEVFTVDADGTVGELSPDADGNAALALSHDASNFAAEALRLPQLLKRGVNQ